MRVKRLRHAVLVAAAGLFAIACDGDAIPPGTERDAAPRDARLDRADRADGDADLDGDVEGDGDVEEDASVDDADGEDGSSPAPCDYGSPVVFELATDIVGAVRRIAVAPAPAPDVGSSFGVVWSDSTARVVPNIMGARVPTTGDPDAVIEVVEIVATSSRADSPALAPSTDGFVLAWRDNRASGYELYTLSLDDDLSARAELVRITENISEDGEPALLPFGGGVLLAWIHTDSSDGGRAVWTQRLDDEGALVPANEALVVTSSTSDPTQPFLGHAKEEDHMGAAVLWAEPSASEPDVMLLGLDENGDASGAPGGLTEENNPDGTVDLALTSEGGAFVFGVLVEGSRHQVRFRALDGAGAPRSVERILTTSTAATGADPSVVAFSTGFAAAYRALTDDGLTAPALRVAFLDVDGVLVSSMDVVTVTADGGPTTIRLAPDGTLLIAWADVTGTTTAIRAARIGCSE